MRRFLLAWACALACCAFVACKNTEWVDARTEVMLRIYNNDPALLQRMTDLRVRVALRDGDGWKVPASEKLPAAKLSWPVDIPIIPRTGRDSFKQFEVVVEAVAADQVLAQARVISGFVPDERRVLELSLFVCPKHEPGFVCAKPDCEGELCSVCSDEGTCVGVDTTRPEDLKPLSSSATQPDAGRETSAEPDAGDEPSGHDAAAASDAATGREAGALDAATQREASALDAATPAEAGLDAAADAGLDAQAPDTGSDPLGGEAGGLLPRDDAGTVPVTPGEYALGIAGMACSTALEQSLACDGHASRQALKCQQGVWLVRQTCAATERCDSRTGAAQGTCAPIASACAGQSAGDVCSGAARVQCGVDLLTTLARPCPAHAHCDDSAGVGCACDLGYAPEPSGTACHDVCDPNPCQHGGTCTHTTQGAAKCDCGANGYTGSVCETAPKFSFFVTSLASLRQLSGSQDGFGGDLRFGELGAGAGLRGADKICAQIADKSLPGASAKQWRAFLSTSTAHAKDRIGQGPWYDRTGRVVAANLTALLKVRPEGAEALIINDLPNEFGVPNHNPDGTGSVDNDDVLTGSDSNGALYCPTNPDLCTCSDWTSAARDNTKPPRIGHAWPRGAAQNWISAHDEAGCGAGVNIVEMGGPVPTNPTVGSGGGYGAFYCFALTP